MKEESILQKAFFGTQNGIKILRMKGTPYEMGYQHGYLLAKQIGIMINTTLQATVAYIAAATGNDLATAEKWFWLGQQAAEPFLPEEFKEEMQGITAGCNAAGVPVTLQQIYLWNTNYDQWCIYAHPHYWHPVDGVGHRPLATIRQGAGGCSSFSAWDAVAGGDGKMIFCKDEDNFNMPGQLDNRTMFIADPDNGYGHVFLSYPGMIGLEAGQSSFGDVYAWFRDLLAWPLRSIPAVQRHLADRDNGTVEEAVEKIIPALSEEAAAIDIDDSLVALDWLNGRRTPFADQKLKGALAGMTLGTNAVKVFRALVESTAFGAKAIIERFTDNFVATNTIYIHQ